jgi:hypothetical protein
LPNPSIKYPGWALLALPALGVSTGFDQSCDPPHTGLLEAASRGWPCARRPLPDSISFQPPARYSEEAVMANEVKSFDAPEETRPFDNGKVDLVEIAGNNVGRGSPTRPT